MKFIRWTIAVAMAFGLFMALTAASTGISANQIRTAAPGAVNVSGVGATEGTSQTVAKSDHGHSLSGTLPIGNGGTGSATKNFVDLTTDQSIAGVKTFTTRVIANAATGIAVQAVSSGATGVTGTGPAVGVTGFGASGTPGSGVEAYGGSAGGYGLWAEGGTTNGIGVHALGYLTGIGAVVVGGNNAKGLTATAGGGNNAGMVGTGTGTGDGVVGVGAGSTTPAVNGVGGSFVGRAAGGRGVTALGVGAFPGIYSTGGAGASGGVFNAAAGGGGAHGAEGYGIGGGYGFYGFGGSTGAGGFFRGGGTNTNGIEASGDGTGAAGLFVGLGTGPGIKATAAGGGSPTAGAIRYTTSTNAPSGPANGDTWVTDTSPYQWGVRLNGVNYKTAPIKAGGCTLNGASPSVCTVALPDTNMVCALMNGTTVSVMPKGVVAASTLTLTGPNGSTDAISTVCFPSQ